jgi:ADP-ribose pyrophosphatase
MKPKPWKTLSSKLVYENPWMSLREDVAEMPNKQTTIYGVVTFGDCVGVVPFVDDEHLILVRQFRYVYGENHRWEIPTGGVKDGETLEQAAQRIGGGGGLSCRPAGSYQQLLYLKVHLR